MCGAIFCDSVAVIELSSNSCADSVDESDWSIWAGVVRELLSLAELINVKLFEYKSLKPESHVSSDDDGGVEKPALNSLDALFVDSASDILDIFLFKSISGDVIVLKPNGIDIGEREKKFMNKVYGTHIKLR